MIKMILQYPLAFVAAVLLHIIILALFLFHVDKEPEPVKISPPTIHAVAVEAQKYQAMLKQTAEAEKLAKLQAAKKREAEKKAEQKRLAKEKARKVAEKKRKIADEKRKAAEKKRIEKEKKAQALKLKKAKEKKAKEEKAKKDKKAAELKRKKALEKKQAEEKKRQEKDRLAKKKAKELADKKKKAEEAKRQKALAEQREREADMLAQLEEEANSRRLQQQQQEMNKYKGLYQNLIGRKFRPPATFKKGVCTVKVKLLPSGGVVDASIAKSSGNALFDEACVKAFYKAAPFPVPKDIALFNREFRNMTIILDPRK